MKSDEAKKLVQQAKAKDGLRSLYERIKADASKGIEYLELRPAELTHMQADLLRKDGYKVEEQMENTSHHYDRASRLGWVVSWKE